MPPLALSVTLPPGGLHFNFTQSEGISKAILLPNGAGKSAVNPPHKFLAGVNLAGASEGFFFFFNGGEKPIKNQLTSRHLSLGGRVKKKKRLKQNA